ncbi:Gfo/Idh/MocA family protein [Zavarzinella formosa]|uniref:Gfo/Idh/MocA family protein n=1 Tax=Zavarzinella formosa TaxID=360055 RepID=UPI0002E3C0F3|nr:Gfo/Idh/MocA family oxidoreductase [Zavarzinella formosa]
MLKFGLLDFDTSHSIEFTRRLNQRDVDKEQFVEGGKIVIGCPGESKLSPERIAGFTETMKKFEVPLVDKPTDMIGKVDVMLIEAVDGSVHYERAKPFLEAGIPCFVDKPFACSVADSKKIIDLAAKKKLPLFSSSSLRFAPELVEFVADTKHGKILGAHVHGPASLHERNPGLFHYGIHAVEVLYTLMGPGCETVTCFSDKGADLATGHWKDGRIASVRGIRTGAAGYGALAFTEKSVSNVAIGTKFIYRELLKKIVETYTTGKPPIDISVTLEIMGFIEAAWKSQNNHGMPQKIES